MTMSKGEEGTAAHLRVLIQTVRECDESFGEFRDEMLKAADKAETFLNREEDHS